MDQQLLYQLQQFLQTELQRQQQMMQLNQAMATQHFPSTRIAQSLQQTTHTPQTPNEKVLVEQLDLKTYKTLPCGFTGVHNMNQCVYFHGVYDRRRADVIYDSEICSSVRNGFQCEQYYACPKSHNQFESQFRPEKYKQKMCDKLINPGSCDMGKFCPFAHEETEIRQELIHNYEFDEDFYIFHFKTIWCPWIYFQHDQDQCVYAHNYCDFRRKPSLYDYQNQKCPNWQPPLEGGYESTCTTKCTKSHGLLEMVYHPTYFKTRSCLNMDQCQVDINRCPFYHGKNDQRFVFFTKIRTLPSEILTGIFKYFPRNRITHGTFKSLLMDSFLHYTQAQNFYQEKKQKTPEMDHALSDQQQFPSVSQPYQNQIQISTDQLSNEFEKLMTLGNQKSQY